MSTECRYCGSTSYGSATTSSPTLPSSSTASAGRWDLVENGTEREARMVSPNVQSASYFQQKGLVSVADGDALRRIKDIAETFGLPMSGHGSIRHGLNWLGAAVCPNKPKIVIWWPTEGNKTGGWINEFMNENQLILESNVNHEKSRLHVEACIAEHKDRAVFAKEHSNGMWYYRFIGLFKMNVEESRRTCKAVWERITNVDRFEVCPRRYVVPHKDK